LIYPDLPSRQIEKGVTD
jgi:ATP-binding cassette, subfamily D (ALD), member 3